MKTEAELEQRIVKAKRWSRVAAVIWVLALIVWIASRRTFWRDVPEVSFIGLAWSRWFAHLVLVATTVAAASLKWRLWRLEDASARARTVAKITGNPNSRVAVLGETEPRSSK